jgi:hypothetical protein
MCISTISRKHSPQEMEGKYDQAKRAPKRFQGGENMCKGEGENKEAVATAH